MSPDDLRNGKTVNHVTAATGAAQGNPHGAGQCEHDDYTGTATTYEVGAGVMIRYVIWGGSQHKGFRWC